MNTATSAAKITSSAINTRNQVFYNHTYSLYLPRRTGQFFVFVAIVIAVIVAVFAAQYKPKKNEENDDSSTFTRDKGWWITVGVFTVLWFVNCVYKHISHYFDTKSNRRRNYGRGCHGTSVRKSQFFTQSKLDVN